MSGGWVLGIVVVIVLVCFYLWWFVGNCFIIQVAFNSSTEECITPTKTPTPLNTKSVDTYNTCRDINKYTLITIQYANVMNWIVFFLLTGIFITYLFSLKSYEYRERFNIGVIICGLPLWLLYFMGIIFMTQYAFSGTYNNCDGKNIYCYELNTSKLILAQAYAVLALLIVNILLFIGIVIKIVS